MHPLRRSVESRPCTVLSHTWKSGQDQVAVMKRQLQLFLPGLRAFLDVE